MTSPGAGIDAALAAAAKTEAALQAEVTADEKRLTADEAAIAALQKPAPDAVSPLRPISGVFGKNSVWKQDVSKAPLHPDSVGMVANLAQQTASLYGGYAAFNNGPFSAAYAPASGARVAMVGTNCQNKTPWPDPTFGPILATGAPLPADAAPASGSDGYLACYDPATDAFWDFWETSKSGSQFAACWGGRIDQASASNGVHVPGMGASASGIAIIDGAVGILEAQAGVINHALSLAILRPAGWDVFVYPANRADGTHDTLPHPIPHGTRLRLDPKVKIASLGLNPFCAMVATAVQKFGYIVTDSSGCTALSGESSALWMARNPGQPDPWTAILGGIANYLIMGGFPWSSLQVIAAGWGKPA